MRCAWAKFKELSPIVTARVPHKGKDSQGLCPESVDDGTDDGEMDVQGVAER